MPQSYDFIFISARDSCEKLQKKSPQGSEQLYPRRCPTLPKALGICARNCRLRVPTFSGVGAHVRGHESSGMWALCCYLILSFQSTNPFPISSSSMARAITFLLSALKGSAYCLAFICSSAASTPPLLLSFNSST